MEDIVLIGCGGHAKSVADALKRQAQYRLVGFVGTAQDVGFSYDDCGVLGDDSRLEHLLSKGVHNAAIAVGYLGKGNLREQLAQMVCRLGYQLPVIADPSGSIADTVALGEGAFVGKMAVINAAATVGRFAIVNTAAVVEHDCLVGDFAHVAVGAVLCGGVAVGSRALIGANAVVLQGRSIGAGALVGAGSVVLRDVAPGERVIGVVK